MVVASAAPERASVPMADTTRATTASDGALSCTVTTITGTPCAQTLCESPTVSINVVETNIRNTVYLLSGASGKPNTTGAISKIP
jgi:hypothetical protein